MDGGKCYEISGVKINRLEPLITDIPEINRQVNIDCRGGLIYYSEGNGASIRSGFIGANGYLAPHKVNGTAYVRIAGGSGIIGLADSEGKSICEIHVEDGDEVIFKEPMELHYYIAGSDGLAYRVVNF